MKKYFFFLAILFSINTLAQDSDSSYKAVDAYVQALGNLDTLNTGNITFLLTKKFNDPKEKARAIYYWITHHIEFDVKALRNTDNSKLTADILLKSRKANGAGFAALFQDMCSIASIRCLTVDGYLKTQVDQISEKPSEINHTWNVVQLDKSPTSWFYVDPMLGSGHLDGKMKKFNRDFTSGYFFANKKTFEFQHFPDNPAWMLGGSPYNLKAFGNYPIINDKGIDFGITHFSPETGHVKHKLKKAMAFNMNLFRDVEIRKVSLLVGEDKKQQRKEVEFTTGNGSLNFMYTFTEADDYPVTILLNDQPVMTYLVDVEE